MAVAIPRSHEFLVAAAKALKLDHLGVFGIKIEADMDSCIKATVTFYPGADSVKDLSAVLADTNIKVVRDKHVCFDPESLI